MKVQALIEKHVEFMQLTKRQRSEQEYRLYLGDIADKEADQLERHQLLQLISQAKSPYAASLTSMLLQRLFAFAVEQGYIESFTNPAERLQLPLPKRMPYVLKPEEMQRILAAIATLRSCPARYLLLLVVHTDLRMEEAKRLRWLEVSLADKRLHLVNSRVVQLNDDAVSLIRSIKRTSSEFVVPSLRDPNSTVTSIQKAWEEVRLRTMLNIRIDDLRKHSAGG